MEKFCFKVGHGSIKKIYVLFVAILFFASAIPVINNHFNENSFLITQASGSTLYVDDNAGGDNYSSIQDAINASSDGDTVIINETSINEGNIIVNKSIILKNGTGVLPVIDCMGMNGFNVTVSNVTIQNITLNNGALGWGVRVYNSSVPSNVLEGVVLDNITVNNSLYGIVFDNATRCNVTYCNVYNSSSAGIAVSYLEIRDVPGYSYCFYINISHCDVSQIIHTQSGPGIKIVNSTYCTISNNTVYNMSYDNGVPAVGIDLERSDFNTIADNNVSSCDSEGIALGYSSDNNTISSNEFYNNTNSGSVWGITIQGGSNNTISENNISYCDLGIYIEIYNSSGDYLSWDGTTSENNTIYLNNIYNNSMGNGFDNCSNNNWNNSTHGNYWDSYNWYTEGAWDNSTDGIFDSPYNIPGGNGVDNYPLRVRWDGNSLPNGTGSIYGYVNGSEGSFGIYGATVVLYHNQTNLFIIDQTNVTGYYNFSNLPSSDDDYHLHFFKDSVLQSTWCTATLSQDPDHQNIDVTAYYWGGGDSFLNPYQSSVNRSYIFNNTIQSFNITLLKETGEGVWLDNLNITLPVGFTFEGENGTSISSSGYTFANTSNKMFWNATSPGGFEISSTNHFWFNASSNASLGSATFNISATNHYGGSQQNLSISVYTTSTFYLSGYIYNITGSPLEGGTAEVTVTGYAESGGPSTLGTFYGDSGEDGSFNITGIPICQNYTEIDTSQVMGPVASGDLFYRIAAYEYNDSSQNYAINASRTLPDLPAAELISMIGNPEFYLIPAVSFNVTAIGPQYNYHESPPTITDYTSKNFSIMIKDQELGYSVNEFDTQSPYRIFSVPAGRNYSFSIYPSESFPISIRLNDIISTCRDDDGDFQISNVTTNCRAYNGTYLVNVTVNTTSFIKPLTGNFTGITNPTSMRIVGYNMETENMVFEQWPLPFNFGYEGGYSNDTYNLTQYNYTIYLPATTAPSNMMLRAYANTSSGYYMGTEIINASDGQLSVSDLNFIMEKLINGTVRSISTNNVANWWTSENIVNTTAVLFKLVSTNGTHLDNQNAFVEVKRTLDDGTDYMTMIDAQNGQFNLSIVNGSSIKKLTIYSQQYAPISAPVSATVLNGTYTGNNSFFNCSNGVCNITMRQFGQFDPLVENSSFTMKMFISNNSCNVPNPPDSYSLGGGMNESNFSPLNAILKGDINMMISTPNVSVYYINVDLLASGPPDAAFTDQGEEEGFTALWKFGSQGPEIYDYVILGVNYTGTPFENASTIRLDIPYLYDNDFNELWNRSKGHNLTHINNWDNLSDYRDFTGAYEAYLDGTGVTASTTDRTLQNGLAYNDETNKTFWFKIPHFSAVGGQIQADYTPDPPSSFIADASDTTDTISLSWTKGNKADYTLIQRKIGQYPSSRTDGTTIYNNTGVTFTNTSLSEDTSYYYRAWSYNTTGGTWSSSYVSDTATTGSSSNPSSPDDGDDDPVIPQQTITADAGGTDGTYTGDEDTAITFNASGSSSDYDDIVGYRWDWTNDGTWDTDWLTTATTTHTFADPGTFTVKLEIKDNSSNTDNDTVEVTVNDVDEKPTISGVSHTPTTVTDEDEVTISATVSDNIGISKVELYWNATQSKNMTTSNNETYTATIGPFPAETTIEYYIKAYDTADQNTTSDTYDFTVETVTVDNETSKEIGNMSSNETQEITEEELKGTNIDKVTVKSNKNLSDIKITIKKLSTKPTDTDEPTEDDVSTDDSEVESVKVYSYMDINLSANQTLSDGDVEITINFKIEKTWLTQNNITKENVVLMRNKNGKWIKLETTVTDENNTHVFFEAVTNGTSTFAIIGSTPKQDTTETGGKDKESSGGIPAIPIVIGVILVIILLIVFLFKSGYLYVEEVEEKEHKKEENPDKEKLLEYYEGPEDKKKKTKESDKKNSKKESTKNKKDKK